MTYKGFLRKDGVITITSMICDGKPLSLPLDVKKGKEKPSKLFLGHVSVGNATITAPHCYALKESCEIFCLSNLSHPFEVRSHDVIYDGTYQTTYFNLFYAEKVECNIERGTTWSNITTIAQIQDIPSGTKLNCAKLVGDNLEFYLEPKVLVTKMKVSCQ